MTKVYLFNERSSGVSSESSELSFPFFFLLVSSQFRLLEIVIKIGRIRFKGLVLFYVKIDINARTKFASCKRNVTFFDRNFRTSCFITMPRIFIYFQRENIFARRNFAEFQLNNKKNCIILG